MSFLGDLWGAVTGQDAAEEAAQASERAANTAAGYKQEGLDYLKESDQPIREAREYALEGLRGFYRPPGEAMSQDELIEQAMQSPLYQAILGSREAGEEAIMRSKSATGGLRSGDTIGELTDYNQQLENQALLQSFNQQQNRQDYERELQLGGLSGLAGMRGFTPNIAAQYGDIGETYAQGITAAAQARQQGKQNMFGNLLGLGTLGLTGFDVGGFSDVRLKENIKYVGRKAGQDWYKWDWNDTAKEELGLEGSSFGVMAHDVYEQVPHAVGVKDGYLFVRYATLDAEYNGEHNG